jgi:two-component system, LytTR family, sensor histidine kinase LytS
MNPHFLINALSVIHHLVRTQPEHARALILDLSDVLQHTLRSGDFVTLGQEIEQTKAYLALEQARYTKRLQIQWAISDQVQLEQLVPTLTLQPLVENAVQHGLAPQPEGGTVRIEILEHRDHLLIRVTDDGVGFEPSSMTNSSIPAGQHIGLSNIAERIRLLYRETYGLEIQSKLGQGTTVMLRLPLGMAAFKPTLAMNPSKKSNAALDLQ